MSYVPYLILFVMSALLLGLFEPDSGEIRIGGKPLNSYSWSYRPILILDEPTSKVDPVSESRIYSEFAEMAEEKTAVFITHRLASTMITDRILVMDSGRIVQSGSHDELMASGGLYADMFRIQKQWYIREDRTEKQEEGTD